MDNTPFRKVLGYLPIAFLALVALVGTWDSSRNPYCANYATDLIKADLDLRYVQYVDPPKAMPEPEGQGHYSGFVGYWDGRTGSEAPFGKYAASKGPFMLAAFQEREHGDWETVVLITKPSCYDAAPGQAIFAKFRVPTQPTIADMEQIPGIVAMQYE